jgi:hypothetical protein
MVFRRFVHLPALKTWLPTQITENHFNTLKVQILVLKCKDHFSKESPNGEKSPM